MLGLKVSGGQILGIAVIVFLTYLNAQGLKPGKIVQDIFTSTKTLALFGLIALGFIVGTNTIATSANFTDFWTPTWTHLTDGNISSLESLSGIAILAAIGVASVGSLFSSDAIPDSKAKH